MVYKTKYNDRINLLYKELNEVETASFELRNLNLKLPRNVQPRRKEYKKYAKHFVVL